MFTNGEASHSEVKNRTIRQNDPLSLLPEENKAKDPFWRVLKFGFESYALYTNFAIRFGMIPHNELLKNVSVEGVGGEGCLRGVGSLL